MARSKPIAHVVGFDDAPFAREHRGDVMIVGAVFAAERLDGILRGKVRRDGANAAREIARMIRSSRFAPQIQLVLLQGIALAGFNVVDVFSLHESLGKPVLIVSRHEPDRDAVRGALTARVPGGRRKWAIVERLGPMERLEGVWVQRVGIDARDAAAVIRRFSIHSRIPEPLRVAHIVAGGLATGESKGRV